MKGAGTEPKCRVWWLSTLWCAVGARERSLAAVELAVVWTCWPENKDYKAGILSEVWLKRCTSLSLVSPKHIITYPKIVVPSSGAILGDTGDT